MIMHHDFRWPGAARVAALIVVSCALLLAGCQSRSTDPSKVLVTGAKITEAPMNSFAVAWRADLPIKDGRLTRLSLSDDRVFAYGKDNTVYWLSRSGGYVTAITDSAVKTDALYNAVVLPDKVVFPSTTQIMVFDKAGKSLYSTKLRYRASSGAVGAGNMVFLGVDHVNGGRLNAISAALQPYDIGPVWELMTRGEVSGSPAVFQGQEQGSIFCGSRDGAVYAVRAENRDLLWPMLEKGFFKTYGQIMADLQADKDGVYVSCTDSKLYCLDMNTGRLKWAYFAGQPLGQESPPVATANHVFVYLPGAGLVCIEKAGRQEIRKAKWTVGEARQFLASDDRLAYLRSADNHILAVDKATGEIRFRSTRTDFAMFATNTSAKDSTIYAARADGYVYAIRAVLKPGTVGEVVMAVR